MMVPWVDCPALQIVTLYRWNFQAANPSRCKRFPAVMMVPWVDCPALQIVTLYRWNFQAANPSRCKRFPAVTVTLVFWTTTGRFGLGAPTMILMEPLVLLETVAA